MRNPFGTDAETVAYAAGQVNLPVLATHLRRIAAEMVAAKSAKRPAVPVTRVIDGRISSRQDEPPDRRVRASSAGGEEK